MKIKNKLLAVFVSVMIFMSIIPLSVWAAPASDIPKEMLDNIYLDALAYTGYDVQTAKDNGTIFKKYGASVDSSILSGIGYDSAFVISGTETIVKSGTATGRAPDIAKFRQKGLCCAAYVSYVYLNYLPNIEGIDVGKYAKPDNPKSSSSWDAAANKWVTAGIARKIAFTQSADGKTFSSTEEIPLGSLLVFKASGTISHVGIYAGAYNGKHFITHVGNSRGPEIIPLEGLIKNGSPELVSSIYVPEFIDGNGVIEIYKKDPSGKSLSGACFVATDLSDNTNQYLIGPTDEKGYAISKERIPYGKYKVVESVFPTNYQSSGQSEWTVEISKENNGVVTINAVNELIPGSVKIVKTSEDGKIEGISFTITGNGINKTVKTDSRGEILLDNILPGIYTVTEQEYDKYEPQESRRVTVVSGQTSTVTFNNKLKRGEVTVIKKSDDNFNEGVKFHLSGTSLSGLTVDEYAVTDQSGVATFKDVLIGKDYVLSEVDVDSKYVIPDTQNVTVEWNKVTNKSFHNILKKFQVTVTKSDDETGTAQGDASLAGAIYGIYKGEQLIDTYTTDSAGKFTTDFYICDDDWTICELSPSEGYQLDKTVYHIGADAKLYTVEYNNTALDVLETVKKGKIAVIKHCDDGSTQIETPEKGAEFEVFIKSAGSYDKAKASERDILICDENGFAETKPLPYGIFTVKQIKGRSGKELMPAFDVFVNENGGIYRFIINNATFEAFVEIVKKDIETGKIIPAAGIGFKVRNADTGEYVVQHINYPTPIDIDTYYTDSTGKLMMPEKLPFGKFELIEVQSCYGYVLDSKPIPFKVDGTQTVVTVEKHNIAQKGIITVSKSGEVFSSVVESKGVYQPIYSTKGLAGAEYEIAAAEDIITLDGTLRYSEGDIVATLTTGLDGTATSEPLYLGKFKITENKAPYGMVINSEPQFVELVYAGQEVEITSASSSFYNERQRVQIDLNKILEQDEKFGIGMNGEILSVQFALFAAEDIVAADGTVIPKDGLIEIVSCNENGKATFKTDLPVDAKLYVKEYSTDKHYLISDKCYPVAFNYAGQDTAVISIDVNEGQAIENSLIRGSVVGRKIDEKGNPLKGAVIGLFKEDCVDFTSENAVLIVTSSADGVFRFDNVPCEKWIIREISAPENYFLNKETYHIEITENEQIIEIEIINEKIPVPEIPKTGDENNVGKWLGIMMISGGFLFLSDIRRRKYVK